MINLQANTTTVIECGIAGDAKWIGIAACGDKLYCAPFNASGMLVIVPQAGMTRGIECGIEGRGKWSDITTCSSKLYCAPSSASGVLVAQQERPLAEQAANLVTDGFMSDIPVLMVNASDATRLREIGRAQFCKPGAPHSLVPPQHNKMIFDLCVPSIDPACF